MGQSKAPALAEGEMSFEMEDSDEISECPTPTPQKPMGVKVLPPVVPTTKKTDIPAKYLPAAAVLTIAPSPKPPPAPKVEPESSLDIEDEDDLPPPPLPQPRRHQGSNQLNPTI